METGDAEVELTIEEPDIPWCQLAFMGKLYAATLSSSKPPDIPPDRWAIALVRAASRRGKFRHRFWAARFTNIDWWRSLETEDRALQRD